MKKLILSMLAIAGVTFSMTAQDDSSGGQTAQGSWLVEANTGFGGGGPLAHSANTSFGLTSFDGNTSWAIGGEAGYFVADDLAVKLGLGYFDSDGNTSGLTYKVGGKYYINSMIPVQVDLTGSSIKDADNNPLWLGLQGGYAIFLGDMVSIEPGLRYNLSLNEDVTDEGLFEFRVGFALHF